MRRYHYVDLLRGLAALTVMVCHYNWFFERVPGVFPRGAPLPYERFLWPAYLYGGLAVPLFWILSGFVFGIAYGGFGKGISIRGFWIRRFSRLYPLHLLTLLIVAALQLVSLRLLGQWQVYSNNDVPHFLLQLFFASNWFTMEGSFNGPIWSVSVEELIYFAFLLYLHFAGMNRAAAIGIAGLAFLVDCLVHSPITQCAALFFAGVAIATVHEQRRLLPAGIAALALLAAIAAGLEAIGQGVHVPTAFIYVGAPGLLLFCIGLDARNLELWRPLQALGLSTYSIYLWHMPVVIALRLCGIIPPLWAFAAIVLPIAHLSFRFIERPAQQFIRARAHISSQ